MSARLPIHDDYEAAAVEFVTPTTVNPLTTYRPRAPLTPLSDDQRRSIIAGAIIDRKGIHGGKADVRAAMRADFLRSPLAFVKAHGIWLTAAERKLFFPDWKTRQKGKPKPLAAPTQAGLAPTELEQTIAAQIERVRTYTPEQLAVAPVSASLAARLPRKPYAANDCDKGTYPRSLATALKCDHIQPNTPWCVWWIVLDIDLKWGERFFDDWPILPNFVVMNRETGKSHVWFALRKPIFTNGGHGRDKAARYLRSIVRGLTRLLNADKRYNGTLAKNPLSPRWLTVTMHERAFTLEDLAANLPFHMMRPWPKESSDEGDGDPRNDPTSRNIQLRDALRDYALRGLHNYKAEGSTQDSLQARLEAKGRELSRTMFDQPLGAGEVRTIAKSVAKFCFTKADPDAFMDRQKARRAARTAKQATNLKEDQPWKKLGMSRAQWFRKGKPMPVEVGDPVTGELTWTAAPNVAGGKATKPRAEYLASSLSQKKPWESDGVSRRTWERRRKALAASS